MRLSGRTALVTGAGSGIGEALALGLAGLGAAVALVGRTEERLATTAREARAAGAPLVLPLPADLADEDSLRALATRVSRELPTLDLLVHCAGLYERGAVASAAIETLDQQYRTNLRAPFLLTQLLLPLLSRGRGDIVFVNSTQGLAASPEVGAFAATQHGLKALADSLRGEVNGFGIRVLTVFLGRTASPRQAGIFALEGRAYEPERLLQPADVAAMVMAAIALPHRAEVTAMALRPSFKSY
ncbi:MAG TPA: SDR family NAD(P)-dependent oxidoreductase [Stellaceae bacterium]|nr:SDR family NAD(P)-dependent oxidoreductase [Stellaceae bacterium]